MIVGNELWVGQRSDWMFYHIANIIVGEFHWCKYLNVLRAMMGATCLTSIYIVIFSIYIVILLIILGIRNWIPFLRFPYKIIWLLWSHKKTRKTMVDTGHFTILSITQRRYWRYSVYIIHDWTEWQTDSHHYYFYMFWDIF